MHLKNILSNFKIIGRAASNASHWQSEARPCAELDGLPLGGVCHLRGLAPSPLSSGRLHHRDEQYRLCYFFLPSARSTTTWRHRKREVERAERSGCPLRAHGQSRTGGHSSRSRGVQQLQQEMSCPMVLLELQRHQSYTPPVIK